MLPFLHVLYSRPVYFPFQPTPYCLPLLITLHTHHHPPLLPSLQRPSTLPAQKHFLQSVPTAHLPLQDHFLHPHTFSPPSHTHSTSPVPSNNPPTPKSHLFCNGIFIHTSSNTTLHFIHFCYKLNALLTSCPDSTSSPFPSLYSTVPFSPKLLKLRPCPYHLPLPPYHLPCTPLPDGYLHSPLTCSPLHVPSASLNDLLPPSCLPYTSWPDTVLTSLTGLLKPLGLPSLAPPSRTPSISLTLTGETPLETLLPSPFAHSPCHTSPYPDTLPPHFFSRLAGSLLYICLHSLPLTRSRTGTSASSIPPSNP